VHADHEATVDQLICPLVRQVQSAAGCVVPWGDATRVSQLILCEGIKTAAALALARQAHEVAVRAVLVRGGQP
jgi:hypothetical protein